MKLPRHNQILPLPRANVVISVPDAPMTLQCAAVAGVLAADEIYFSRKGLVFA
jgi:hypothetical protein